MAKHDTRYPRGYFEQHPKELPEVLEGHDFFAVTKTRLPGNDNRTTLLEFRPKQLKALVESVQKSARKKASVTSAKLKKAVSELEAKSIQQKVRLKQARAEADSAASAVEDLEATLDAVVAERDAALEQVAMLSKKTRGASDEAKTIKRLEGELQRIKGLWGEKHQENERLDDRLSELCTENDRQRIDLGKTEKANAELTKYLQAVKAALLKKGINLDEAVPETSGMKTSSSVLADSSIIVRTNKPVPGSNPG